MKRGLAACAAVAFGSAVSLVLMPTATLLLALLIRRSGEDVL